MAVSHVRAALQEITQTYAAWLLSLASHHLECTWLPYIVLDLTIKLLHHLFTVMVSQWLKYMRML